MEIWISNSIWVDDDKLNNCKSLFYAEEMLFKTSRFSFLRFID